MSTEAEPTAARPRPDATAVDEHPVFLPATTGDLLAVVTEPPVPANGLAAVLLRGAGWRPSSGPRRTQVAIARRLAGRGFHALRFSYHGLAESGGTGDEIVRLDRPYVADARAAVDWATAQGLRSVLIGNCFGARTALATAVEAPDAVSGLVLTVSPVHDFEVVRRLDRRPLGHFARRLRPGRVWAVITDRRRRRALGRTGRGLADLAGRRVRLGRSAEPEWLSRRFLAQVAAVVDRGVPALFLYGDEDRYGEDFTRARQGELGRLLDRAGGRVTVAFVPGRVHGLTSVATQDAALAAVDDWAAANVEVTHVVDSLAASGGAENRLVDEVIALSTLGRGIDQRVVRLYEHDDLDGRLAAAGIPVVPLGFAARQAGRTWPLAARRLWAVLRERRPDVVHTSLFSGNLVGQLAARPLGLPVVSSFNRTGDLALQRSLQPGVAGWRGRAMQRVARVAAGRGDVRFRAVGAYARDTNCALLGVPPGRATVVPRGISLADLPGPGRRADFGLPADGPLVVNVARLVPEKAQHLLVEAFAAAREELPGAHLAIAGAPGSNQGAVRTAVARYRLKGAVTLLGFRPDVRALVAAADVFAFTSLSEGSPGAVLEALALGAPVVAFAIPPVGELTDGGRHARLVPTGSVPDLAAAVVAAVREPAADRADRVAAARSWAAGFDLPAVAARLADLLAARAGATVVVG